MPPGSGVRTRTSFIHIPVMVTPSATPIQSLVAGLTADGVFSKLDRLWVFAQATSALALVDLVAADTASAVNAPTFTANRGYTGDGATSYVDLTFNPATDGVNYTQDAASHGVWAVTDGSGSAHGVDTAGFTSNCDIQTNNGGNFIGYVNSSQPFSFSTSSQLTGLFSAVRTGAANGLTYQNATADSIGVPVSASPPNGNAFVGGRNLIGSGFNNGSTQQIAASYWGGLLTATDITNLYTRLRTYMTAVGVP